MGLFLWRFLDPGNLGSPADPRDLAVPFSKHLLPLGMAGFVGLTTAVLVASSNAVNLTDGLDGLAVGTAGIAALALSVLTYVAGHRFFAGYLNLPWVPPAGEVTVIGGALGGACLGFLWWNCHPAEVFMGDTGALSLGGGLGYLAVVSRNELLLAVIGGVFVIEAGSVVLQVLSYRWRNRRIFLCAPYHHHLQYKGWHENQITVRFWILSIIFALIGVATLKIR